MSRTRRNVPHWVKKSEIWDRAKESLGEVIHWGSRHRFYTEREKRFPLRKQVETGNFDMSDHEHSEDIERRQQIRARIEDRAAREDL